MRGERGSKHINMLLKYYTFYILDKIIITKQLIFKAVFIYHNAEAVSIKVINMDVTIQLNHVDIVHFGSKGAFMALKHV